VDDVQCEHVRTYIWQENIEEVFDADESGNGDDGEEEYIGKSRETAAVQFIECYIRDVLRYPRKVAEHSFYSLNVIESFLESSVICSTKWRISWILFNSISGLSILFCITILIKELLDHTMSHINERWVRKFEWQCKQWYNMREKNLFIDK